MDFEAKVQSVLSAKVSQTPTEAYAQSLLQDQPTIDSALKSYMSLVSARSLTASDIDVIHSHPTAINNDDNNVSSCVSVSSPESQKCFFTNTNLTPQKASLLCARSMSKIINSFIVPPFQQSKLPNIISSSDNYDRNRTNNNHEECKNNVMNVHDDKSIEYEVVRVIWNRLIHNEKKPSQILGRSSLTHIYPLILDQISSHPDYGSDLTHENQSSIFPKEVPLDELKMFFEEFGRLLKQANDRNNDMSANSKNDDSNTSNLLDDDSSLLWDKDGGAAELLRRRVRRGNVSSSDRDDESKSSIVNPSES